MSEIIKLLFILVLCLVFNIFVHEAGHIVYYIAKKVKIKAVSFYNFVVVLWDKKLKFYRVKNVSKAFVIPKITGNIELEEYEKVVLNDLLAGPFLTMLLLLFWLIVRIYFEGSMSSQFHIIIVMNIAMNLSIMSGCFRRNNELIGDIAFYNQCKKKKADIKTYIIDYIVWNGGMEVNQQWIDSVIFNGLAENEKYDFAFCVVTLYMLGNIKSVNEDINKYIYLFIKENKQTEKNLITLRFKDYIQYIEGKQISDFKEYDIKVDSVPEIIYRSACIEKNIYERLGVDNGKNIGSQVVEKNI